MRVNASPDGLAVTAFLARVTRRLLVLRALEGAALGLVVGLTTSLVLSSPRLATASLALGMGVIGATGRAAMGDRFRPGWWRETPAIADRVERRAPRCRNIVFTAAELADGPSAAHAAVRNRVYSDAQRAVGNLDPGELFPALTPALGLVAALLFLTASLIWTPSPSSTTGVSNTETSLQRVAIDGVDVEVRPPSYSGRSVQSLVDPARVEALAGSRLRVRVRGTAAAVRLETIAGRIELERDGNGWSTELPATGDDFLAIEAMDQRGGTGARRMVAVSVTPDRPPQVRITNPGRDLFFSAVPDSLVIEVEADDDLGLSSLRLRYTSASGTGEQFTFREQDVPFSVTRRDGRHWTARAVWRLRELRLTPSDMVVYRAEARDRRPDGVPAPSESFVIELVAPGAFASEGFAADDERDRYAVSQQMVIIKTERLLSRRADAPADSVAQASRQLAAEQRRVRAEFLFMMGGELEDTGDSLSGTLLVDEVAEAESEGDVLAGRLANRSRVEMQRALRAMSRAAAGLVDADLERALADERVALDNLMRAFARSRFLLRALTQRERLDLNRRLSGTLADARRDTRDRVDPATEPRAAELRRILVEVASLSARPTFDADASRSAASFALALMRVDPSGDSLRAIVTRLRAVADSMGRVPVARSRAMLEQAALDLAVVVRIGVPVAPLRVRSIERDALGGALTDALRRGKGGL
ncbi:MAG TPA: hypothetical protein VF981_03660 [Gemmatimonadaceae bacterium]